MLHLTSRAKKGAALPRLRQDLAAAIEAAGARLPDAVREVALRARDAASPLIVAAPAGARVTTQIGVELDPLGGYSVSVLVDVRPAKAADPSKGEER